MKKEVYFLILAFISIVIFNGCTSTDSIDAPEIQNMPDIQENEEQIIYQEINNKEEENQNDAELDNKKENATQENKSAEPVIKEEIKEPKNVEEENEEQVALIINGKTLEESLDDAYDNLHEKGSSKKVEKDFPDAELVYTDEGKNTGFPSEILPFHYYYSEEANTTFNLCGVGRTVFICEGMLDEMLTTEHIESGRCRITEEYDIDPRLN